MADQARTPARAKKRIKTIPPRTTVDNTIFPFERLPAELRNTIYKLDLVSDVPIRITHSRGRRSTAKLLANGVTWTPNTDEVRPHGHLMVDDNEYKKLGASSLMRTGRAVYEEATSVLYGCNTFALASAPSLRTLLTFIGARTESLRYVSLEGWSPADVCKGLELLAKSTHLRELALGVPLYHTLRHPHDRRAVVCNTFGTVLKAMGDAVQEYVAWDETAAGRRVRFDSLRFTPFKHAHPYEHYVVSDGKGEVIEEEAAAMQYLKRRFEKVLVKRDFLAPLAVDA